MKRIVIILSLLIAAFDVCGQKLTVEKMEVAPMDLSASTQPRNDRNENPCALVKVQLATPGASFEGNVIGDTEFKKGEYWVYMSEGSYMLNIKHSSFLPLFVNFRDYDIKRVEGKTTYVLTLVMPQASATVKKQKLIVNYSPKDAIVTIDSESYWGDGHLELDLDVGSHDYQIVAKGYEAVAGSVKLSENAPRTITEHLVAKSAQPQQQQSQVVAQQPVQSQPVQQPVQTQLQPVDEFEGKTASEIADIAEDYYYGRNGKSKEYAQAVKWARKAAEMGNSRGQFRLGYCYYNGLGVTQDYAEAVKWYRKAIEQGHVTAQCNLGVCYEKGHGVTQDYAEAVKWYRKAAERGYAYAQCNLGVCYYHGRGVTKDYAEAVRWYRKAAEQGHATAQNNLGWCYYNGQGVTKDYAEAVKWLRKAAEQGNALAQCSLGVCYYNGEGVTQDRDQARELWRKAAAQGHQTAKDNLKKCFGE